MLRAESRGGCECQGSELGGDVIPICVFPVKAPGRGFRSGVERMIVRAV